MNEISSRQELVEHIQDSFRHESVFVKVATLRVIQVFNSAVPAAAITITSAVVVAATIAVAAAVAAVTVATGIPIAATIVAALAGA